jgi:hypothetical protein
MVNPAGPIFVGGFEEFVVKHERAQYTILYLPDRRNNELKQLNLPQVYYWMPGEVRLAREGDGGDFKFHHTHFVGVMDKQTHVAVDGKAEVQGGMLSFTTTMRYPTAVLRQAETQLLEKFRGSSASYWGWNSRVAPMFRIVPIASNQTVMTNLSPDRSGASPLEGQPIPAPAPAEGGVAPPGGMRSEDAPPPLALRALDLDGPVAHGRDFQPRSALEAWAFKMQGQGAGSTTGGENAYNALMGAYPSEILWSSFHGTYSHMSIAQNLLMPMWTEALSLKIHGNWDRINEHFSAHANYRNLWFDGDLKAEFNRMRASGIIKVELSIDGTVPNAQEMERGIQARIDAIYQTFVQQANERIFSPPDPEVQPAQASSSGGFLSRLFGGGGVAIKYRRDSRKLNLEYNETRNIRYNHPTTISGQMKGMFDEMKQDPKAAEKYFSRLVLGELGRKVYRQAKEVIRFRQPGSEYIGDPVKFASIQVGYPTSDGSLAWQSHPFTKASADDDPRVFEFVRWREGEVRNPPAGWTPDKTFVKRAIHFDESMGMTDDPYVKVMVEKKTVLIDGESGSLMNDNIIEVRADGTGKLELELSCIDVYLENANQVVEVEIKPEGRTDEGQERPAVSFLYKHDDQDRTRIFEVFTGQPHFRPEYKYRVHVRVKGTLFSRGMAWSGPWRQGNSNGSIAVHVPTLEDEGVTNVTRFAPDEVFARFSESTADHPAETPAAPPPDDEYRPDEGSVVVPIGDGQVTPPPGMRTNGEDGIGGYTITPGAPH